MGWIDQRRPGLGTGFFLVVLLGVALPLGLVGLWLAHTTQRSAETLVRDRLAATLDEMIPPVARAWERERSRLLRLAGTPAVQEALAGTGAVPGTDAEPGTGARPGTDGGIGIDSDPDPPGPEGPSPLPDEMARLWDALAGSADRVVFRDVEGRDRGVLERDPGGVVTPRTSLESALIHVRVDVHEPWGGARLGTLEAALRAGALLPGDVLLPPGVSGAVLALFDPRDGSPLLPLPMDPDLFHQARFERGGERWVVAHRRLHEPALSLALAGPVGPMADPLREAARQGILALTLVTAGALIITFLLSRRLTRPLVALAGAADDVAQGRLDRSVPEDGPDEMRRLAGAFNAMTGSLRATLDRLTHYEALAAMGEMAASLAHEVRNPLTAVQVDLERARRRLAAGDPGAEDLLDRALRQLERLDASVTDALSLARSGRVELGPVELAGPLIAAGEGAEPRFAEREATLELPAGLGEEVVVRGDAALLEQLFLNLLLNAADALSPGQWARVDVEVEDEAVRVRVRDVGAGMSPEVRDRILEPFFSTKARGSGLGLPIARRIALSHGGTLEVVSTVDRGTTVTVTLPAA